MKNKPLKPVQPERAEYLANKSNRLIAALRAVDLSPEEIYMVLSNSTVAIATEMGISREVFLGDIGQTHDYHRLHKNPGLIEVIQAKPHL